MVLEFRLSIQALPLDASGLSKTDDSCDERVTFHTFRPAFIPRAPVHIPLKHTVTVNILYFLFHHHEHSREIKVTLTVKH